MKPTDGALEAYRNDAERLGAVVRTGLLDSPAEEDFDRLTRLATRLTGAPVSFLSLVDADRDFYKSAAGFGEPLASERQLQGRTFCHHALASDRPLVIDDTLADPVFAAVPTVGTLGVRAYAGVRLLDDDGHAIGSFCAIDFAPRQWTEGDIQVLRELAESAAREIRLRGALRRAQASSETARAALRQHEQVVASVAHDLRSPLQVLALNTQVLRHPATSAQQREEQLVRSAAAIAQMQSLIDDMLQRERGHDERADARVTIGAALLIGEAIATMRPIAERCGLILSTNAEQTLPTVEVHFQRILRVFANLIGNALKFSPPASTVRVEAQGVAHAIRFSVADQGPGLSDAARTRVFDRHWQGDPSDGRGLGLGLSIARAIVEEHDGAIGVEAAPGGGSIFFFTLPTRKGQVIP